jgi:2-methylcitrate dehydratase PrpD
VASSPSPITRELARLAVRSSFAALPPAVQQESARTFLNYVGCTLGGCHDPAAEIAAAVAREGAGRAQASVVGHKFRTDLASAAFVNCLSSCVLAFDDTHLATVTHPTGPVAAALCAWAEQHPISGEEFANALALGIEVECRLSNVLLMPPAQANLSLYITGITGPIGAAVALARAMRLDEDRTTWAIGLAAAQGAGMRSTHGSMAAFFVPAHAARCGVSAALLAARGFTGSEATLEGGKGFIEVFAPAADPMQAIEGFGQRFELMANAYKPYPCGIVIHAAIDACLDAATQMPSAGSIEAVRLKVHPLTVSLTDRPQPKVPIDAQISLQHWAAACFVHRAAGLAQVRQECIDDPAVAALRARVSALGDASLARDEAIVEVLLSDGRTVSAHVPHARGSLARPMTDGELDDKFLDQARAVLGEDASRELLRRCRALAALDDVGGQLSALLDA